MKFLDVCYTAPSLGFEFCSHFASFRWSRKRVKQNKVKRNQPKKNVAQLMGLLKNNSNSGPMGRAMSVSIATCGAMLVCAYISRSFNTCQSKDRTMLYIYI